MSTPPPLEYTGQDRQPTGILVALLRMVRILCILCALTFAGTGGFLAWHFFFFVKDIVEQPDIVVGRWQTLMAEARTPTPLWPGPGESEPAIQPPVEPQASAAPEAVPPADATEPAVTPEPSPPTTEVEAPPEPSVSTVEEPLPAPSPTEPQYAAPHPDENLKLFFDFAETVMDRFETGQFSWLFGMAFLAIFCWVLGKVPAVMISTGAKVLVDLVNFDIKKS